MVSSPPLLHGATGIQYEVDCHLAILIPVDQDLGEAVVKIGLDGDSTHVGVVCRKLNNLREQRVNIR